MIKLIYYTTKLIVTPKTCRARFIFYLNCIQYVNRLKMQSSDISRTTIRNESMIIVFLDTWLHLKVSYKYCNRLPSPPIKALL